MATEDSVAEVARTLAANLRAARAARRWRLEDLAEHSGVSRGMIHQIENQRTNPSVATLARLCTALDVPVSELIELPGQLGSVHRRCDAAVTHHGVDGRSEAALLISDGRHELWEHELLPGDEIHDAGHPAGTRELIHAIGGTLVVDVGSASFTVAARDALDIRADRPHTYRNAARHPARYTVTVVYTGARDDRFPLLA
ncbi:helix-turn-helix domain-containing protein [Jiangella asiatica]|uniref:XRE family transcriptional regulator n=1 Tax=Jiangella asiatica TaxID=2530372 RepID=A0A4R5CL23_9ACTN|nr:helix-turn-helix domain-containing protein [Jiangella asiatica]TDE01022.1 XRE family transcriptional regulator [Jiangella asiatica]